MKSKTEQEAKNVEVIRQFYEQVVNGGNIDRVGDYWAKNMVSRFPGTETIGLENYRQGLASAKDMLADMKLTPKEIIAKDDQVIVHFINSGTNVGPFMGFTATGKHVEWEGIGIYTLKDGKIIEALFVEDFLGMMQKLGNISLP